MKSHGLLRYETSHGVISFMNSHDKFVYVLFVNANHLNTNAACVFYRSIGEKTSKLFS